MKHLRRWWWLIFVVGVGLRLFNLGARPLWYDHYWQAPSIEVWLLERNGSAD